MHVFRIEQESDCRLLAEPHVLQMWEVHLLIHFVVLGFVTC